MQTLRSREIAIRDVHSIRNETIRNDKTPFQEVMRHMPIAVAALASGTIIATFTPTPVSAVSVDQAIKEAIAAHETVKIAPNGQITIGDCKASCAPAHHAKHVVKHAKHVVAHKAAHTQKTAPVPQAVAQAPVQAAPQPYAVVQPVPVYAGNSACNPANVAQYWYDPSYQRAILQDNGCVPPGYFNQGYRGYNNYGRNGYNQGNRGNYSNQNRTTVQQQYQNRPAPMVQMQAPQMTISAAPRGGMVQMQSPQGRVSGGHSEGHRR